MNVHNESNLYPYYSPLLILLLVYTVCSKNHHQQCNLEFQKREQEKWEHFHFLCLFPTHALFTITKYFLLYTLESFVKKNQPCCRGFHLYGAAFICCNWRFYTPGWRSNLWLDMCKLKITTELTKKILLKNAFKSVCLHLKKKI